MICQAFTFSTVVEVAPDTVLYGRRRLHGGRAGRLRGPMLLQIELGLGLALLAIAVAMLAGLLNWFPAGGDAMSLTGWKLILASAVSFGLVIHTIGVGFYAPCMALLYAGHEPQGHLPHHGDLDGHAHLGRESAVHHGKGPRPQGVPGPGPLRRLGSAPGGLRRGLPALDRPQMGGAGGDPLHGCDHAAVGGSEIGQAGSVLTSRNWNAPVVRALRSCLITFLRVFRAVYSGVLDQRVYIADSLFASVGKTHWPRTVQLPLYQRKVR